MTWEIRRVDEARSGLFADDNLVVTVDDGHALRLLRLRDRLVAKQRPDARILVVFRPGDVAGLTDVSVAGEDDMAEAAYLDLIEQAAWRLHAYVQDYHEARRLDLQPALL